MSDLVKPSKMSDLSRVEINVLTEATPIPGLLRYVRDLVQRTPTIAALFMQARKEQRGALWLRDRLVLELADFLNGEEAENIFQVATYLSDEYMQIGDAVLLLDPKTGKAIARISDEDMWQPAPVPRENGRMAVPAKRLRPELEGFLVQWVFDRSFETEIVQKLAAKITQTQLQRDEGDRRLAFATRDGRKHMVDELRDMLPSLLPNRVGGTPRTLFNHLQIGTPPEGEGWELLPSQPIVREVVHLLQDKLAQNLGHDILATMSSTIAVGWTRGVAARLNAAPSVTPDVSFGDVGTGELWIASPDIARKFQGSSREANVLPIEMEDAAALRLNGLVGWVMPELFELEARELFDRWTIRATFTPRIWVNWANVRKFTFYDVPATVHVEIM